MRSTGLRSNPRSRIVSPPKDMFRLCRHGEWDLFVQKCRDEPEKIFWIGSKGQNLLHFICTRRPDTQAIIEFIKIWPEALLKEDEDGCLPIHMAMTNGASHRNLCLLISKAPACILHNNKWRYRPFDWIWRRCKYELQHLSEEDNHDEKEQILNTIQVMVQAASFQCGALKDGTLLHKATDFDCPIDLIEYFVSKFPFMASYKDSLGRTPLARAVSSSHFASNQLVTVLLHHNPESALLVDDNGRTPFHLAILNRISWSQGLKEIVNTAPTCLLDKDPVTQLFPYQLMASNADEGELSYKISDIFEALYHNPEILPR